MRFNCAPRHSLLGSLLLVGTMVQGCHAQQPPDLREFMQRLNQTNGEPLPKFDKLLQVTDTIAGMPEDQLAAALPSVISVLQNPNTEAKVQAAFALTVIGRRADSAQLLGPNLAPLRALFEESDSRLQSTPALVFLSLRPSPPPEVVPMLTGFLRRNDRDPGAQVHAIFALVRLAPDDKDALAAELDFLNRPLRNGTRVDALNALQTPALKDSRVIGKVVDSLEDPNPDVRFTAVQVVRNIGKDAVRQAEPALRRMAENTETPAGDDNARRVEIQTRQYAKQALELLARP